MKVNLRVLPGLFTIHRFSPNQKIPKQVYESQFYSISRSEDELSIVCSSSVLIASQKAESGWSCIQVLGPLDFSLTGILADISAALANRTISIFAVSTFDTDYVLVKSDKRKDAQKALRQAGYTFT